MKLFLILTAVFTCIVYAFAIGGIAAISFVSWDVSLAQEVMPQLFDWTAFRVTVVIAAICALCFCLDPYP